MKNTVLIITGLIFSFSSFAQKGTKYPDYFVQKDTIWCRVNWYSSTEINYSDKIIDLMGYNPITVKKSSLSGFKIVSSNAINKDIITENRKTTNSYVPMISGDYLKRAGNLGLASYGIGFLTGGIVLLMPNDNADIKGIVGVAGGLLSLGFAISAWNNIKLAGKYLDSKNTSVLISPSNIKFSYRF